ncbi:BQ5605_C029g10659 [Microbotryum silenes-dioicae]|uniref:BQ5605_C029g10659 protein n=1 Tax=Microbotryum silenes-dioicae TaxID=796604 RepID=A0A2X0PJ71_9BASI|nr:BQ5605_C029g10659 [Microbotryum silenes-dioicae]
MVVTAWIGKKARSFYWIVFLPDFRRLNSQHSRLSQGGPSGVVGVTSSWGLAAASQLNNKKTVYELVFESDQACLEAAAAGPFRYHGKEMVTELPSTSPLDRIVQVRFTLPPQFTAIPASVLRKSLDDAVTASLGRAGRTQGYTLMQLQRGLATDSTDPMAMTEDGYHCAYLRLPADLFQGSAETQKAALNAALPHEIAILGTKFGLRHEFETHYCGLCDRAGHKWGTCRKPASTSVSGPSAPVPGARTSTSTPTPTGGFRVAGKNGKHGGPTPLTSRASSTNMIQLGPRTNPATDLASANDTFFFL